MNQNSRTVSVSREEFWVLNFVRDQNLIVRDLERSMDQFNRPMNISNDEFILLNFLRGPNVTNIVDSTDTVAGAAGEL